MTRSKKYTSENQLTVFRRPYISIEIRCLLFLFKSYSSLDSILRFGQSKVSGETTSDTMEQILRSRETGDLYKTPKTRIVLLTTGKDFTKGLKVESRRQKTHGTLSKKNRLFYFKGDIL